MHFNPMAEATQSLLTWLFHMLRSVLTCHSSKASDPEQPIGIGRSRPRHAVSRFAVLRANSDVSTRRRPRLLSPGFLWLYLRHTSPGDDGLLLEPPRPGYENLK